MASKEGACPSRAAGQLFVLEGKEKTEDGRATPRFGWAVALPRGLSLQG